MYQIMCGEFPLYDPRNERLILLNPRCKLEANTVGEGSFTILKEHPNYNQLENLKSIFEYRQNGQVIFRGRMTGNSRDFHNRLQVDLEGVLGFANDSIIEPFTFPDDFPDAANAENMVEYFFNWILQQHNAQVETWQQLKPGNVTVTDPNNYIARSSKDYDTTWNTLNTKLVDLLGGYLVIRYESDGNYVDYVSSFELTNTQSVTLGENLIDIISQSDATSTYSAILPMGKAGDTNNDQRLTLESLPDGSLTDDLVKQGKFIYSVSKVEEYGWICVPPSESIWDDVTDANNLKTKSMEYLTGTAMLLSGTTTIKAVDLSFTDDQIQAFRVYRNILVNIPTHGVENGSYPLTRLDIDVLNPQNTLITFGETIRSLVDINRQQQTKNQSQVENTKNELKDFVSSVEHGLTERIEDIDGVYFYIKYSQYADGHAMTDTPNDATKYMGVCSTNQPEAPTDYTQYTWSQCRGEDGTNGSGISSITEEYYLSTSKTTQTGGSWLTTPPTWSVGKYMWTRSKIVYSNPTSTAYTTPICDSSWEAVNEVQVGGRNWLTNSGYMKTTTGWRSYTNVSNIAIESDSIYGSVLTATGTETNSRLVVGKYIPHLEKKNRKLTFSMVYKKGENATDVGVGGKYSNNDTSGEVSAFQATNYKFTDLGNGFTQLVCDINLTYTDSTRSFFIYIYTRIQTIKIAYCKLEDGDKVTDWTPAPEDVQGQIDTSIKVVDVEYYLSTSQTTLSDGSWSTTAPTWVNGKYMWSRTKTTLQDGTVSYKPSVNGTCIAGAKGDTGSPGTKGDDGRTSYLHIKYSNDGTSFTANNGEELGEYIGTLVDFNEADSTTFSDYTWKKFTEDVDEELEEIRHVVSEQYTQLINDSTQILLSALESYVETSNFDQYKETVETQLQILSDEILMHFTTVTDQIVNVDGDLQRKFTEIYNYISFADGNITLGSSENAITLTIENDMIVFKKNGLQFGWWDGVDFHTGNIVVEVNERAQFGNFAFVPRSNGSLSFLKVGG